MSILITHAKLRTGKPYLLDYGGELTPALGGAVQRLNRLGNRYAIDVTVPPLPEEPDGRIVTALLRQAKSEGALYPFPQPGLKIGAPGAPVVAGAVAGGTSLPIRAATPGYAVRFGQFLSIVHGGRRYLHSAAAPVVVAADGTAAITLIEMLRTPLSDGDTVELAKPMIEGLLASGNLSWDIQLEPYTGVAFTISEQK
ncbi:MAG TPA: hypothetical protein VGF77_08490 [Allosphingosinicella sp.]